MTDHLNSLASSIHWVLVIMVVLLASAVVLSALVAEPNAKAKCEKLDLELLDYSSSSIFLRGSITCYNPKTMEVVKIK